MESPREGFEQPSVTYLKERRKEGVLEKVVLENPDNVREIGETLEGLDYMNQFLEVQDYDFREDFSKKTCDTGRITYGDGTVEKVKTEVDRTRNMQDVRFKGDELRLTRQGQFSKEEYESNHLTLPMLLAGVAEDADPAEAKSCYAFWPFNRVLKNASPKRNKEGLEILLLSERGGLPPIRMEEGSCDREAKVIVPSRKHDTVYGISWRGLPTGEDYHSEWPDVSTSGSEEGICKDKEVGDISHKFQYYQDFICAHDVTSYYWLAKDGNWEKEDLKTNIFPIPRPEYADHMDRAKDRIVLNNEGEDRRPLGETEQGVLSMEYLIRNGFNDSFEDDIYAENFKEILEDIDASDYIKAVA